MRTKNTKEVFSIRICCEYLFIGCHTNIHNANKLWYKCILTYNKTCIGGTINLCLIPLVFMKVHRRGFLLYGSFYHLRYDINY